MPRPDNIEDLELLFRGGFYPSAPDLPPRELENTIKDALNIWLRPLGGIEVAKGSAQVSSQNVGARMFAIGESSSKRATIAGGLVSGRLPYAGIQRYENAVLFFLSELTSQQVYLDETAITGLTTSATAGMLRLGLPAGGGTFTTIDAGFNPPNLPSANVTITSGGTKNMLGSTGIALCAWRQKTNAISAPSVIYYKDCVPGSTDLFKVVLIAYATGQDGWALVGTRRGDQSGDVRIIRYIYKTPRGTFSAINGNVNITGDANTRWLEDLRPGDSLAIPGVGGGIGIATVTSNNTATLTGGFSGATNSGYIFDFNNLDTVAADWYNSELGALVNRDAFKPPRAAGVLVFGNRVFLWGTYGESASSVTGPAITPMLEDNPEHVGRFNILTASGSDLINVLAGDDQLFLMTATSLESAAWSGQTDRPYVPRVLGGTSGFKSPKNGVFDGNFFFGYSDKPLRTNGIGNVDVKFGEPVWKRMETWNPQNVVVGVDPRQVCVLFAHYDGVSTTEVIPWMTQQEQWGGPHSVSGQVVDMAVVNNTGYLVLLTGGNYRVHQWEGGAGASPAWVASQLLDIGLSRRYRIKGLQPTCKATNLRIYLHQPGGAIPDVSNAGAADANFTLSNTKITEPIIGTHLQGRAMAYRLDFDTDGSFDKIVPQGYPLDERR